MKFEHRTTLSSGDLTYRLFSMAATLQSDLSEAIGKGIMYNGPRDTSAKFKLSLLGVPSGIEMSVVQTEYFQKSATAFLGGMITEPVFAVEVQGQTVQEGASLTARLEINGEIRGGQENYALDQIFADNVKAALNSYKDRFVEGLAFNALRPPSTLSGDEAAFFRGLDGLESEIEAVVRAPLALDSNKVPTQAPMGANGYGGAVNDVVSSADDSSSVTLFVVGAIGILLLGVLIGVYRYFFMSKEGDSLQSPTKPQTKSGAGKEHAKLMAESRDIESSPDETAKQSSIRSPSSRTFLDKQTSLRSNFSADGLESRPTVRRELSADDLPLRGSMSRTQSIFLPKSVSNLDADSNDRRPPLRSKSSDGASKDLQPLQRVPSFADGSGRRPPARSKSSDGSSRDLLPLQRPLPMGMSSDNRPPLRSKSSDGATTGLKPPLSPERRKSSDGAMTSSTQPIGRPRSTSTDGAGDLRPVQRSQSIDGDASVRRAPLRAMSSDGINNGSQPMRPPQPLTRTKSFDGDNTPSQPARSSGPGDRPRPPMRSKSFDGSSNQPPPLQRSASTSDGAGFGDRRPPPQRNVSSDNIPRAQDSAPQQPRRGRRRERSSDDMSVDSDSQPTASRTNFKRSQSDENLLDHIKSDPSNARPRQPSRGPPPGPLRRTPSLGGPNQPPGAAGAQLGRPRPNEANTALKPPAPSKWPSLGAVRQLATNGPGNDAQTRKPMGPSKWPAAATVANLGKAQGHPDNQNRNTPNGPQKQGPPARSNEGRRPEAMSRESSMRSVDSTMSNGPPRGVGRPQPNQPNRPMGAGGRGPRPQQPPPPQLARVPSRRPSQ
jgi:hypothetical protein